MKNNVWRIVLGVILVLFGALALLQNYTGFVLQGDWWGIVFALIFAGAGAAFLASFFADRKTNWWAVIPGFTLIGLGLLIVGGLLNFRPEGVLPGIFLGSIGASFLVIYFSDRVKWWAIIPGGVLVSLAIMLIAGANDNWAPVILFAGMAVTFGLVATMNEPGGRPRTWAWYPAGAMAVLAVIIASTSGPLTGLIWPILLIGAGLVMVAWTLVARRS